MMQVDVPLLPLKALGVASFGARRQQPYLDAFEELRIAVLTAFDESQQGPPQPYERIKLTVVCYTGKKRRDGRGRPEQIRTWHYLLDPIYRVLIEAGVIKELAAIMDEEVIRVPDSPREGFRIQVDEIAA